MIFNRRGNLSSHARIFDEKVFPIVLVPIYFALSKYIKLKTIFYFILISTLLSSIYFSLLNFL